MTNAATQPFQPAQPVVPTSAEAEVLGYRLRRLRRARLLSTRALALRLGRNHSLVVRWERGQREPTLFDLAQLARCFGITVDALLADTRAPSRASRTCSSRAHSRTRRQALGRQLTAARRLRGLTVWEARLATGIRGQRLRAIERGVDAGLSELQALGRVYALNWEQILRILDGVTVLPKVRGSTPR